MLRYAPPTTDAVVRVRVRDFTTTPGPATIREGGHSGERFREVFLSFPFHEARRGGRRLVVDLDGTGEYPHPFLEEAFGGLARRYGVREVLERVEVVSEERPHLREVVRACIAGARG